MPIGTENGVLMTNNGDDVDEATQVEKHRSQLFLGRFRPNQAHSALREGVRSCSRSVGTWGHRKARFLDLSMSRSTVSCGGGSGVAGCCRRLSNPKERENEGETKIGQDYRVEELSTSS